MDAFANVFAYALAGTGLTAISNDPEYPGLVVFRADPTMYPEAGNKAVSFSIHNVEYTPWVLRFDLAEIDVTTDAFTVDDYIEGVEYMLQTSISSASFLGSLQMRIDLQTDFASRLSDSIDKGIGRLVDADMNEASTRLKALQTQEQLAINLCRSPTAMLKTSCNSSADQARSLLETARTFFGFAMVGNVDELVS